ncbi:hypothetical protein [Streptomyces sp. PRh5]|uniref:hypothetical protein n=1 Tax=Streptomyces sp. PRh5 TaxID=1158056 RepID=UPI0004B54AFE|nr:hypothetical protein [Streptomyces sp. PRh5]
MQPITALTGLVSAPSRGLNGLRLRFADITDVLRDTGDATGWSWTRPGCGCWR